MLAGLKTGNMFNYAFMSIEQLEEEGYVHPTNVTGCLAYLKQRLCPTDDFPHEIGIFLGYPIEDVVGFIKHCGLNCKYCGHWKV